MGTTGAPKFLEPSRKSSGGRLRDPEQSERCRLEADLDVLAGPRRLRDSGTPTRSRRFHVHGLATTWSWRLDAANIREQVPQWPDAFHGEPAGILAS